MAMRTASCSSRRGLQGMGRVARLHQRIGVVRQACRLGKIKRVRPDDDRLAERQRLDEILPAQILKTAADDRDIAHREVSRHLAHRIAQPDVAIGRRRGRPAASRSAQAGGLDQCEHAFEALRMACSFALPTGALSCSVA